MTRRTLIILGASGNAHDLLDIVAALNAPRPMWDIAGFLDDSLPQGSQLWGRKVLGPLRAAAGFHDCYFINCIGSERSHRQRPQMIARTRLTAMRFATLVHPQASVSSRAQLGRGVYVSFGASVGGMSVLGDHVSLAPGAIVGHDSSVADYALLAPGATVSGSVQVGQAAYLGARSVVKQGLSIGAGALLGMGAVVTRAVDPEMTVVGVPARPLYHKQTPSRGDSAATYSIHGPCSPAEAAAGSPLSQERIQ
ncbi:MAG: NeuD/PglB/VioB family sugar acetyltransferase [Planctomycetales bacterium]|nr:NeuD/PglB/VioB family sugar acetyltransferase [Planctomycetales bacterium]